MDLRAASRASDRAAPLSCSAAALSGFTYGRSKRPSSNLARRTRATALSITFGAIDPPRIAARYDLPCLYSDSKMTSRPASSECFVADAVIFELEYRQGKSYLAASRSEEHTSELQSHVNLVCRLLLVKK